MAAETRYPSFNVMKEQDAWDDHTQSIVQSRIQLKGAYDFLTLDEAVILKAICSIMTDDYRTDIVSYIVEHIDSTLHSSVGESQRKLGLPKAQDLVRGGLAALQQSTASLYGGKSFDYLDGPEQQHILKQLSEGQLEPSEYWTSIPQKPLFEKILGWTVEAYCSHPTVWSEMGYAGPAYPRGYIRTQIGQLDPWEAQPEHE